MSNSEKNGLHGKYSPSGYNFGGQGTNKTSFAEIGVVAPFGCTVNTGVNPNTGVPNVGES